MDREAGELYREFCEGRAIADLSDRVKLALRGADRVRYLNGQVTSNVTRLEAGRAQAACVVSAKGKLQAEIWISATDDVLFVDGDAALRDLLQPRLEKYVIADDVTIDDVSDDWRLMHLFGSVQGRLLPPAVRLVASRRFHVDGTDAWIPASMVTDILPSLTADRVQLNEQVLESVRIEHGIARWQRELDDQTLPPEAGLDRTHIDYQKGCYVGQEVVSRLKSVGHVNRRLVGYVAVDPRHSLVAPMTVTLDAGGAPAGQITSAAWSFALVRHVALGYLKRGMPKTGLTAYDSAANASIAVTVQELPFVS